MHQVSEAGRRLGFRIHAIVFVPVILLLAAFNFWKGEPYWIVWPVLGWGIGLLAHWFFVLGPGARRAHRS